MSSVESTLNSRLTDSSALDVGDRSVEPLFRVAFPTAGGVGNGRARAALARRLQLGLAHLAVQEALAAVKSSFI